MLNGRIGMIRTQKKATSLSDRATPTYLMILLSIGYYKELKLRRYATMLLRPQTPQESLLQR
jgi:hypothetical protein